jgi:hypothetical protein
MNVVYPEPQKTFTGCDEWCIPLHLVEKAVAGKRFAEGFSVWDFMVMGRVEDENGSIVLYKHCDTRRYINVDEAGHAYRYSPGRPQSGRRGDYLPLRTLSEAIAHLDLDFLNFSGRSDALPNERDQVAPAQPDLPRRQRKKPRSGS